MAFLYSTAILIASTTYALAWDVTPTPTAVPGPVAGVGLPVLGAYVLYRLYRKRAKN